MQGIIEISRNEMRKLMTRLENGQVSDAPCLLEQWLREGKLTEDEAIIEANTSFGAGVDSVCYLAKLLTMWCNHLIYRQQTRLYSSFTP